MTPFQSVEITVVTDNVVQDRDHRTVLIDLLAREGFDVHSRSFAEVKAAAPYTDKFGVLFILHGRDAVSQTVSLRGAGLLAPVLAVTDSRAGIVTALHSGADDAVAATTGGTGEAAGDWTTGSAWLNELVARVTALSRREAVAEKEDGEITEITVGDLTLYPETRQGSRAGVPMSLTYTETAILRLLMRNSPHVVSRDEIMDCVWPDGDGTPTRLSLHLTHLRQKIERQGLPLMLHTLRGAGISVQTGAVAE